ncbi:MAG: hypothetical protein ABSA02_03160 [Trebonia sp.]|jgi:hypothetical protein
MLLSGVLFVLFLAGCWLYCLTDAALTPAEAFPGWRKRTWIAVIALTLIAGAIAWLIARRNWRSHQWSAADTANLMIIDRSGANVLWYPYAPAEPGEPTIPRGPDDDPQFIRQLAQRIHGSPTDTAE